MFIMYYVLTVSQFYHTKVYLSTLPRSIIIKKILFQEKILSTIALNLFQESRTDRVNSWRSWKKGGKKSKGVFRPPKSKAEQR